MHFPDSGGYPPCPEVCCFPNQALKVTTPPQPRGAGFGWRQVDFTTFLKSMIDKKYKAEGREDAFSSYGEDADVCAQGSSPICFYSRVQGIFYLTNTFLRSKLRGRKCAYVDYYTNLILLSILSISNLFSHVQVHEHTSRNSIKVSQ